MNRDGAPIALVVRGAAPPCILPPASANYVQNGFKVPSELHLKACSTGSIAISSSWHWEFRQIVSQGRRNSYSEYGRSIRSRLGIEVDEAAALLLSAGFSFCVLCSFYILRPLRDETAILFGPSYVQYALSVTFMIMLAIVPVVGFLVSYVPQIGRAHV